MSGPIVRSGPSPQFTKNWDGIFGKGPAAKSTAKKSAAKKTTAKAVKKKSAKKKK
jgi:hypothetical protein